MQSKQTLENVPHDFKYHAEIRYETERGFSFTNAMGNDDYSSQTTCNSGSYHFTSSYNDAQKTPAGDRCYTMEADASASVTACLLLKLAKFKVCALREFSNAICCSAEKF